jgi:hypothetical protein
MRSCAGLSSSGTGSTVLCIATFTQAMCGFARWPSSTMAALKSCQIPPHNLPRKVRFWRDSKAVMHRIANPRCRWCTEGDYERTVRLEGSVSHPEGQISPHKETP